MKRIKKSQVAKVREHLLSIQEGRCFACGCDFSEMTWHYKKGKMVPKFKACLDHDHKTGHIRGVLCDVCNGLEGKITNYLDRFGNDGVDRISRISGVADYLRFYSRVRTEYVHYSHRTEEEKAVRAAKRRRAHRLVKKQLEE